MIYAHVFVYSRDADIAFKEFIAEHNPTRMRRFCTRPLYSIEYQYMRADDFCSYGEREEEDIPMEYFENGGI